jgi:hypothetical protein
MVTSLKGLGPENDYAGEASRIYKIQTRPLVREGNYDTFIMAAPLIGYAKEEKGLSDFCNRM